jgi:hypothetical protein
VPTVLKSGSLNLLEPSGIVQACNRIALPLNIITFYLKESDIFIIIYTKEYDNAVVTYQISISNTVDGIAVSVIVGNCCDEFCYFKILLIN